MTVNELSRRPADAAESARAAPVIVMAYSGSGADQLRSALATSPGLTCTTGTGILPLCQHVVSTWQTIDGRDGAAVSPLGAASARSLGAGLMTAVLASQGGSRWCEFTSAPMTAAATFARLYPQARFLVLHRRADAVVRTIIAASRWGLAGSEFTPFVSAHPGSSVAALASYWATHTSQQLDFEEAHRESCLRVRIEDLAANPEQTMLDIGGFLSLEASGGPAWLSHDRAGQPVDAGPAATGIPLVQIPPPLLAQLNDLHQRLGYPPLTAAAA
jgi:Sulfotransferase family